MELGLMAVLGLAGLMVAQFSLLWYRLGRMEQMLKDHCDHAHLERRSDGQG